jgi:hypothetical protein
LRSGFALFSHLRRKTPLETKMASIYAVIRWHMLCGIAFTKGTIKSGGEILPALQK